MNADVAASPPKQFPLALPLDHHSRIFAECNWSSRQYRDLPSQLEQMVAATVDPSSVATMLAARRVLAAKLFASAVPGSGKRLLVSGKIYV